MLRSECKQPDMSKYVLKTSVPSFKCPPCPPCICKCDGSAYDPAVDGDGNVVREEADGSPDGSGTKDAVAAEEALGGNRDTSQSSADFNSGDLTGSGASSSGTGGGSGGGYGSSSSGYGSGSSGGGFGSLGGSAFGFGGGLFGRSSNGGGGVGANSAGADFEGACAASDNDAYNGSYSVQPVIQD